MYEIRISNVARDVEPADVEDLLISVYQCSSCVRNADGVYVASFEDETDAEYAVTTLNNVDVVGDGHWQVVMSSAKAPGVVTTALKISGFPLDLANEKLKASLGVFPGFVRVAIMKHPSGPKKGTSAGYAYADFNTVEQANFVIRSKNGSTEFGAPLQVCLKADAPCVLGSKCKRKNCPFRHEDRPLVNSNTPNCKHGAKCNKRDSCKFKHPSDPVDVAANNSSNDKSTVVYVAGLPKVDTVTFLQSVLAKFKQPCKSYRVGKKFTNTGDKYAFVDFHSHEQALEAIKFMNGGVFHSRPIIAKFKDKKDKDSDKKAGLVSPPSTLVSESSASTSSSTGTPTSSASRSDNNKPTVVYICGLPKDSTVDYLNNLLINHKHYYKSTTLKKKPGKMGGLAYGFVEFDSHEKALEAIGYFSGGTFDNHTLLARFKDAKAKDKNSTKSDKGECKYGINCIKEGCIYSHPPGWVPGKNKMAPPSPSTNNKKGTADSASTTSSTSSPATSSSRSVDNNKRPVVYIAGLPKGSTVEFLDAVLKNHGIKYKKSSVGHKTHQKTYGLVEFYSHAKARKAILYLNGRILDGHTHTIQARFYEEDAPEITGGQKDQQTNVAPPKFAVIRSTLFLQNLPMTVHEHVVTAFVKGNTPADGASAGNSGILKVVVFPVKDHKSKAAYVDFTSQVKAEAAIRCLKNQRINGVIPLIQFKRVKNSDAPAASAQEGNFTVKISNLDFHVNDSQLRFRFRGTNFVTCAIVLNKRGRSKGQAIVTFNSELYAQDFIEKRDKQIINGRPIRVNLFTSTAPHMPKATAEEKEKEVDENMEILQDQLQLKQMEIDHMEMSKAADKLERQLRIQELQGARDKLLKETEEKERKKKKEAEMAEKRKEEAALRHQLADIKAQLQVQQYEKEIMLLKRKAERQEKEAILNKEIADMKVIAEQEKELLKIRKEIAEREKLQREIAALVAERNAADVEMDSSPPDWDGSAGWAPSMLVSAERFQVESIDSGLRCSSKSTMAIRVKERPFSRGSFRLAYYAQDCATKQKFIGKKPIATKGSEQDREFLLDNIETLLIAQFLAKQFNTQRAVTKHVNFVSCVLISFTRHDKSIEYMILEDILTSFMKFSNNKGFVSKEANHATVNAFPHFTHHTTGGKLMVVDIQGMKAGETGFTLTDPGIHCLDYDRFGEGNFGAKGFDNFFESHQCNQICRELGLLRHAKQVGPDVETATAIRPGAESRAFPPASPRLASAFARPVGIPARPTGRALRPAGPPARSTFY